MYINRYATLYRDKHRNKNATIEIGTLLGNATTELDTEINMLLL